MHLAETVYVLDDESVIRDSLQKLLRHLQVQAFSSATEFLKAFQADGPTCVLMDFKLQGTDGLTVMRNLFDERILCPVIFLSAHADLAKVTQAMKLGAWDFIAKPFLAEELRNKVNACLQADRQRVELDFRHQDISTRMRQLTPRENEVLRFVVNGKPSKVIAGDLGISENTLETHRRNILSKMRASNAADLASMVTFAETLNHQLESRRLRLI